MCIKGSALKKMLIIFFIAGLCFTTLFTHHEEWSQLLDIPVIDMSVSSIPGIGMDGLVFLTSGEDNGVAFFEETEVFSVFEFGLPIVSIVPDNTNNRILCVTGGDSPIDGLYYFDIVTQEYELILEQPGGRVIRTLPSGFYFGWGTDLGAGGLYHSPDGEEWNEMEFFASLHVFNIVETSDGTLFIATLDGVFIIDSENDDPVFSRDTGFVSDIYVRRYPYDSEVYVTYGSGSYSDGLYRLHYDEGEVTDVTLVNYVMMANRIYEYGAYFVIGSIGYGSNLFLVEATPHGEVYQIGEELGINAVYCFETLPVYTHNFAAGTDAGVFWGRNIVVSTDEDVVIEPEGVRLAQNYPNPFNPETAIAFDIPFSGQVTLIVYNLHGQKIKTLKDSYLSEGTHSVTWHGDNESGKPAASGIYFYELSLNGEVSAVRKCLLLK